MKLNYSGDLKGCEKKTKFHWNVLKIWRKKYQILFKRLKIWRKKISNFIETF